MSLRAVRDTIIVKTIYAERNEGGKIIIPDYKGSKKYHADFYGEVISVGPKYPYKVKPGDKIYFRRHEGKKIFYEGEEYIVLSEKFVEARIDG